jgi:hypothetical protein
MPKTTAEVRQRVGEDLGLVPVGQNLEAQDVTRIDAAYLEQYERIKEKGLAAWPSTGPIQDKFVPSLCLLIASRLLVSYSVPESRYVRISNEAGPDGKLALANLAELVTPEFESHSEPADY